MNSGGEGTCWYPALPGELLRSASGLGIISSLLYPAPDLSTGFQLGDWGGWEEEEGEEEPWLLLVRRSSSRTSTMMASSSKLLLACFLCRNEDQSKNVGKRDVRFHRHSPLAFGVRHGY